MTGEESARWRRLADALVDGFDPITGLYEEFAGFSALEPLVIRDIAPRRPIVADLLLGPDEVHRAQIVKQADVLMLHHLLPDEVAAGSLGANLDFYEPRTAHGSSLSPGIHASLLARAGRPDAALAMLRVTAGIDTNDVGRTGAGGVHLAAMGSLWQALAYGFAGLRPLGDALVIDPCLPASWPAFEIRIAVPGCPAASAARTTRGRGPGLGAGARDRRRSPGRVRGRRNARSAFPATRCIMIILAALDDSTAAGPVLETAQRVANLLGVRVEAVHVRGAGTGAVAAAVADSGAGAAGRAGG